MSQVVCAFLQFASQFCWFLSPFPPHYIFAQLEQNSWSDGTFHFLVGKTLEKLMSVSQVVCTFSSVCLAILLIFVPFAPPLQCHENSNFQWQTWFLWHCNGGGKGVRKLAKLRGRRLSNCSFSGGPDVDPRGQIYETNWKKCTDHLRHGHQLLIKKKSHFLNLTQDPSLNFSETAIQLMRFFGKSGFLSISLLFFLLGRRAIARNAFSEPELRGRLKKLHIPT